MNMSRSARNLFFTDSLICFLIICLCVTSWFFWSPKAFAIPTAGHQMMVAGPSPYIITTAQDIIGAGGNVVDAAVAISLTLAVTSPYYASLGGGGFALLKMEDKIEALDFREVAPLAMDRNSFSSNNHNQSLSSTLGGASVGVPGLPAGLKTLHQKYGKLPWKRLFNEALKLAQEGFRVSGEWVKHTLKEQKAFNEAGQKYLFKPNKSSYKPGELIKQVALAQALLEFRNKGPDGFYQGAVARDLIKSVNASGGRLTPQDLKNYEPRWREPMIHSFMGHKIYLMPPPSSGGVILSTAFSLTDKLNLTKYKMLSLEELHLMAEILSRAFRGRALLGDPEFYKNPTNTLLSAAYLSELANSIHLDKSTSLPPLKEIASEGTQTTHVSIADKDGHAIAITLTLNGIYGSRILSQRFGIALNNQMDDFNTHPGEANQYGLIQGEGNIIQAGKRPLSSMSPTLVEKNGRLVLALGAPGGPHIISAIFQVLYRLIVNKLNLDEAIQAPRVHHQFLPNKLYLDEHRFAPETIAGLVKKDHLLDFNHMGRVYAVQIQDDGTLNAAFDSRSEGAAGGF